MICKYCGTQLDNNAEFCSFCGRKVIHVPPVFTMTNIGTDIATEAIRDYSEWGFYNNPDAELDPETGRKPEYSYSALDALPDENHMKWARDFIEADQIAAEFISPAEAEAAEDDGAEAADGYVEESEEDTDDTKAKAPAKARKKKVPAVLIVLLLFVLAAAIGAGAYFLLEEDEVYEVDLNAIMAEPKVIGYNTFGEMALMPQIDDAKADEWLRTVRFDNDREAFSQVLDTVTYTPDKTEKLANGDVVNITVTYDRRLAEECELTVKAQPATYEVSGLEKGKDLAYDPDAYHAYYDDFILPESDRTFLTREDVIYSTNGNEELIQQAINEIYARHGYIFENEHYDKLFRGFEWYVPMYKPKKFHDSWLNKYEKANLNLVTEYRDDLRAAAAKAAEEKAAAEKASREAEKKKETTTKPTKKPQ